MSVTLAAFSTSEEMQRLLIETTLTYRDQSMRNGCARGGRTVTSQ